MKKSVLEDYIFGPAKDRALKIALLTRDIRGSIESRIVNEFVSKLESNLCDKGLPSIFYCPTDFSKKYQSIKWRSPQWGKGWYIGIGFDFPNYRQGGWGFCAPNTSAANHPNNTEGSHALDGSIREVIISEIRKRNFRGGLPKEWSWWPAFFEVSGLQNWLETECLLKLAGVELHDGMPFVDWLAGDLELLYRTVDKVLSEHAQSQP
ncbi:hypothetical protein [Rhodomicrobium lacus]|uniref:hypothetical protein n=1 Tax=Rhodomicrobium lacus TaxID=2498452 RepID=UPI000F8C38FF|nr:hypothetical protein [Rhodomicrobium lacus]